MSGMRSRTGRPNVLLIVFDTARADAFSPYAVGGETPALAQLASRGTAYPHAIAPSCWTLPSHASMLLGKPPRSLGLSNAPGGNGKLCAPVIAGQSDRYLPEVLRREGYGTAAISTNLWVSSDNGFSHGFEEYHDLKGDQVSKMGGSGRWKKLSLYEAALRASADHGAAAVQALTRKWLSTTPHDPFFWFVNLMECHSPYIPPKPFNDFGPLGRLATTRDSIKYVTLEGVLRTIATGNAPPPRALRRMRHLYDRAIALMDGWLTQILDMLDGNGLLDETLVLVTSDHGENFGEGGLIGHGGSLDDRLLRVPLVVAGPGVGTAPNVVTSLDRIPQIVAEHVGIDHPWGDGSQPGLAVAQYDGPVDMSDPRADFIKRLHPSPERLKRLTERFTCVTDGALKVVDSGRDVQLFDLESDPLEIDPLPLGSFPPGRTAQLVQELERVRDESWYPASIPNANSVDEDNTELEERMRLLGYL